MSDAQTISEVAGPSPPSVLIGPGDEGLFVGMIHKAGQLRTFVADGVETMLRRIESILIGEFGTTQAVASSTASDAVANHVAAATLPDAHSEALQEIELLRGELGQAHMKIASLIEPPPPPPPTLPPDKPPPAPKLAVVPTQDPAVEGKG
jgi:hypothetical protein